MRSIDTFDVKGRVSLGVTQALRLAKYVGKDLEGGGQRAGLHRYEVAQGFQPRAVPIHAHTSDEVLGWAETFMGTAPERVWRSRDEAEWSGPPALWAAWA